MPLSLLLQAIPTRLIQLNWVDLTIIGAGPFTGSSCNAASPFTGANFAPGLRAWSTKFHTNSTTSPATTSLTETTFSKEPLSPGELAKLTGLCQFLSGNQSGAGLCKACTLGGLGAGRR